MAVGRSDHLVSRDAVLGNRGYLPARLWIDNAESLLAFIGHDQQSWSRSGLGNLERQRTEENEPRAGQRSGDCHFGCNTSGDQGNTGEITMENRYNSSPATGRLFLPARLSNRFALLIFARPARS